MKILPKSVLLVTAATLLACVHGLFLGKSVWSGVDPGAISVEAAKDLANVFWVDARSRQTYDAEHLPKAVNLNEDDWESGLEQLLLRWEPDQPIVVYCDGGGCESSRTVAARLRDVLGVEAIYWLKGGWTALREQGIQP